VSWRYSRAVRTGARHASADDRRARSAWRRGWLLALLAGAVALVLVAHAWLPDAGGLGSLVETFLPWWGLAVPVVLVGAAVRRAATAAVAAVLPAAAWAWVFAPQLLAAAPPIDGGFVVVHHNVMDTNTDADGTAAVLLEEHPDVVTLVEVTPELVAEFTAAFGDELPHRAVQGTVGVWSRHPLTDAEAVDLRPSGADATWDRGLRVTVDHGATDGLRLYAVHLPSVRPGPAGLDTAARDESIRRLGDVLATDDAPALVVGGDLNAVLDDCALAPVTAEVTAPRNGFGFTFPAAAPVVRIDHVLARGATVTATGTLGRTGSDHLPVVAEVALPPR
jgi:vancomycin resistance protein VanJ